MGRRRLLTLTSVAMGGALAQAVGCARAQRAPGLWQVWDEAFARARFVSLSHVLEPSTPIWYGFDPTRLAFRPASSGNASVKPVGEPYTYEADGFEATDALLRDLNRHARARLGSAVAPREIQVIDILPKTRSGKIMRRLLKARELGLPEGDTSTLEED